jgi:glycosyltransferase involved in cell wall biosynthesis
MLRSRGKLGLSHATDMNSNDAVLVISGEWASTHGGISTLNRHLCTALASQGLSVYCVVLTATPREHADAAARGVTLIEILTDTHSPELALARRPAMPGNVIPAVVIGHGRVTGPAALSVARDQFLNAQLVHFIHTAPDEIEWLKTGRIGDAGHRAEQRTRLEIALAQAADHVYALGPQLHRRYLNELHGAGVVPGRIDPGFDHDGSSSAAPPPGAPIRVLATGRAEDALIKGLDLAARAMGIVARRRSDATEVELLVRGAPAGRAASLRKKLQRWARNSALHIVVRPYSTDQAALSRELHSASLVLMPSRFEGFGLAGVEAITAGVPLLTTSRSGLALLLRDLLPVEQANQHIVETTGDDNGDAQRWGRAIETALHDRDAAFHRAASLRAVMSDQRTWCSSITPLLMDLGLTEYVDVASREGSALRAPALGYEKQSAAGLEQ